MSDGPSTGSLGSALPRKAPTCAGEPCAERRDAIEQLPSVSGTVPAGTLAPRCLTSANVKNVLIYDIFEGTAEIQQFVIARAMSGMHIE